MRRAGITGLQRIQQERQRFEDVGTTLQQQQLEQMMSQMKLFKENLQIFAEKYKKQIKGDVKFRLEFQRICDQIGIDPLASNKGFWAEFLGVGDFYYNLSIQIAQICLLTRPSNGGWLELSKLLYHIHAMRLKNDVSKEDVIKSIELLKPLGGFQLVKIGDVTLISSVGKELSTDTTKILDLAQGKGYVVMDELIDLGWNMERIKSVLWNGIRDGTIWIDEGVEPKQYWIPAFFKM